MNEISNLFGLSALESKVLEAVRLEAKIVAKIARDTKTPRTSIDAVVERLARRGLLQKNKREKRFYYRRTSNQDIIQQFFLCKNLPSGVYDVPLFENSKIIIHSGTEEILNIYELLFTKYSKSRIYGIQPTSSALRILDKIPQKKVDYINSLISKNKTVNEVIIEDDYFEKIKSSNPKNFKGWLKIFINRAAITHVVKKGAISFQSELILHDKTALLIEWQNSIAIEISHPEIVKMFFDLFRNFQLLGTRIEYSCLAEKYQLKK